MCTAMMHKGSYSFFGRNLDMEKSFDEKIIFVPRNFRFDFMSDSKERFAMCGIGIVIDGYPLFYDGMNEKGLAVAGLRFKDAKYASEVTKNSVAPHELIPLLLSECECVEDAIKLIDKIMITEINFSDKYPWAPLHWMISDKDKSITVECVNGETVIFENKPGILTNMPTFDYQLFNLSNYINLTSSFPQNRFSNALSPEIYSYGMGAIGLPGDMSSMSRFVRGTFVKMNTDTDFKDKKEEMSHFFHMLYSVYQPKGCTRIENGDDEFTLYTSCYNLDEKTLTLTTYDNWNFETFDMKNEYAGSDTLANYPIKWK